MDRILDLLKKNRGLEVSCEYEYEHTDTPAGRVAVKHDKKDIRSIFVPLRDDEWCSLCMRDGADYIGGCCGQTGQTQDILNNIFRDSGWIDCATAEELIAVAGSHDGFGILTERSEDKLIEAEAAWNDLDPHGKIFLCVAAAIPFMKTKGPSTTSDPNGADDVMSNLYNNSCYLSWKELFAVDPEDMQRHGNKALRVARLVPAARAFLDQAARVVPFPFQGYAVADREGKIAENGRGHAIFQHKAEAENLLEIWKKNAEQKEFFSRLSIRKIQITLESGVEFLSG